MISHKLIVLFLIFTFSSASRPSETVGHPPKSQVAKDYGESIHSKVSQIRESIDDFDISKILENCQELSSQKTETRKLEKLQSQWLTAGYFNIYLLVKHSEDSSQSNDFDLNMIYREFMDHALGLIDLDPENSDAHAMLSVVYGLRISEKPISAFRLGPKLMKHRKKALQAIDRNPRISLLEAISRIYRSKSNDSRRKLLGLLLKAEELFKEERKSSPVGKSDDRLWGYTMNQLFLAETYEKIGNHLLALNYFNNAKQLSPNMERAAKGIDRCKIKLIKR